MNSNTSAPFQPPKCHFPTGMSILNDFSVPDLNSQIFWNAELQTKFGGDNYVSAIGMHMNIWLSLMASIFGA